MPASLLHHCSVRIVYCKGRLFQFFNGVSHVYARTLAKITMTGIVLSLQGAEPGPFPLITFRASTQMSVVQSVWQHTQSIVYRVVLICQTLHFSPKSCDFIFNYCGDLYCKAIYARTGWKGCCTLQFPVLIRTDPLDEDVKDVGFSRSKHWFASDGILIPILSTI